MYFFDWTIILVIPGLLLALWAQSRVTSAFNHYSSRYSTHGASAQTVARRILDDHNLYDVEIQTVPGNLSDNYNPANRTLYLSQNVYGSRSISAIGVAAHEAGHAIQHDTGYRPLIIRTFIYPAVRIALHSLGLFLSSV